MVTEVGKVLRIVRINTGDSLRDMAAKIGMSAAYLSAIETGKRNVPDTLFNSVCEKYPLSDVDKNRLKEAIESATVKMKINLTDMEEKRKKIIYSLTKDDIDDATLDRLCEIIFKESNK